MKLDTNVWERIEFEGYKRKTRDERVKILKEKLSPPKKTSKL